MQSRSSVLRPTSLSAAAEHNKRQRAVSAAVLAMASAPSAVEVTCKNGCIMAAAMLHAAVGGRPGEQQQRECKKCEIQQEERGSLKKRND